MHSRRRRAGLLSSRALRNLSDRQRRLLLEFLTSPHSLARCFNSQSGVSELAGILKAAIEEFTDKAQQEAKANQGQKPPNPEMIKAEAEKMKAQAEIRRQEVENEGERTNAQIEFQTKQMDVRMKEMEMRMKEMELAMKGAELEHGHAQKQMEFEHGRMEMGHKQMEMGHKKMEIEHKTRQLGMRKASEVGMEGDGYVDPNVILIAEAVKHFDKASRRNTAPREIVRDKNGRATHIVTKFKE